MEPKQYAVGDKVYIYTRLYHFVKGLVIKITPSGMIDIQTESGQVHRFNKDGRCTKEDYPGAMRDCLDHVPYEERRQRLVRQGALKEAAYSITKIQATAGVNYQWEKDGLQREIDRLQGLLNDAKTMLEAVK